MASLSRRIPLIVPALIEVRNLVKQFRGVRAVDGASFSIRKGTCFGLLGPNGAGKTTTIEILEGITSPTSGELFYQGEPLGRRFRDEAGIMFQSTSLQEHITVREALKLFARLYPRSVPLKDLVASCSLEDILDRDTHKLSGGQRQRLLLAIALVNDPEVLFLDEPTTGLDPQARRRLWDLVRDIKQRGKTVLLTTHYMEEAYVLCDEIAIMDHGRIIAEGSPKALLAEHFHDVVLDLPAEDFHPDREDPELTALHCGDRVELLSSDVNDTIRRLIDAGVPLGRLQIRERTLDDLFLELTGKDLRK
ncbi:ABC-2 type transport system ATP-binding protein [Thiohalomonas denitrificans]|uniref:ABC-2 type transport system ATP-binding protein n=1 Tax=Thiohalomonas denitrificans TaxID=415747 RepID=A0A1G5Q8R1_9GAMM|nr:ABC-2 type transport system ATP-binding protein [Thiohalomonas denitrificans]